MREHRGIEAVSLLATAAGAAAMILFAVSRNIAPSDDAVPAAEIGRALAAETLARLAPRGRVVVFARDTAEFPQPSADLALDAFRRALAGAGHAEATLRLVAEDPLRPLRVPEGDVFDVLRRSKPGDVVVSFLGPALLSEEQRNALGHGPRASVVAFCPGAIPTVLDLRRIAGMGLLHGAVLARTPVPSSGSPPGGSPGFDTLYRRADAKSLLEGTFMEPPR